MKKDSIKITEIENKLHQIPKNTLDDLQDYLNSLMHSSQVKMEKPVLLSGIWKRAGFENISDIENEITETRKELSDSITHKIS